jgi:hypothetical protein
MPDTITAGGEEIADNKRDAADEPRKERIEDEREPLLARRGVTGFREQPIVQRIPSVPHFFEARPLIRERLQTDGGEGKNERLDHEDHQDRLPVDLAQPTARRRRRLGRRRDGVWCFRICSH